MIFLCRWVEVSLKWKKGGVMVACDFVKWECWSCSSDTGVKYEQILLQKKTKDEQRPIIRERKVQRYFFAVSFLFFIFFSVNINASKFDKGGPFLVEKFWCHATHIQLHNFVHNSIMWRVVVNCVIKCCTRISLFYLRFFLSVIR